MKKVKWKKLLLIFLTCICVTTVAAGSYGWKIVTSTFADIQEDIDRKETEKRLEGINFKEKDPLSVLLMGIDEPGSKQDTNQRADALILLTVNPKKKSTHMVSIPRDTYTEIIGRGEKDKINHSFAFGGTKMTVRTVENFLNTPVDYFIRLDMKGLEDMINAVDGVKVNNHLGFTYRRDEFKKGIIHLNGDEAVNYSRMRHKDPRGDLGRQKRQRKVIKGIMDKGTSLTSITRHKEILEVVGDHVRTNLSLEEIWNIQSNYKNALETVNQHEISGKDGNMDNTYYYLPDKEKLQTLSKTLRKHLELKKDKNGA
ncbi:transcriptional attenuator, LytR family [Halobacillus alkaliphilus]|uniref:Transcriptional attenuator, LytR family n=1 Tax=Halobacillus alkaliphilus TaxID=396056 RepID=A0A1I2L4D0_9BACI|nr:LCP family protein [Halobacillus alkaliphilus]SFF73408.1 transcriptional attenuator, LytR family [Halobacillus alkaliphilus]